MFCEPKVTSSISSRTEIASSIAVSARVYARSLQQPANGASAGARRSLGGDEDDKPFFKKHETEVGY